MLKHPRFKPHYRVEVVEGEGVFVLSEAQQTVLQGRLYEMVAPLLDGRPVEEVCALLRERVPPARVFYTVNRLEQGGYLCEANGAFPGDQAAFWSALGLDLHSVTAQVAQAAVGLTELGLSAAPLAALLRQAGVSVREGAGEAAADLQVVVADHYLRKELEAINRAALKEGRPWLLVKPVGTQLWLGPLFRPGATGCWECLARRVRANFPVLGYLEVLRADQGPPSTWRGTTEGSLSAAWGLAAQAVLSWLAHGKQEENLEGKVLSLDLLTWQMQSHRLLRQAACPACGTGPAPAERAAALTLENRKKAYIDDGGHRAHSPQETIDRFSHHISPICGAVSMLEPALGTGDGVMHVYLSGNNSARAANSLFNLKVGLRNSSCGKGMTDLQARASALCEALERYSGNFQGDEPRRRARLEELGEQAIHPNAVMLFSDRQYRKAEEDDTGGSIYNVVPWPFDPAAEVEWSPVWSLTRQATRYLPTGFCYYEYAHDCQSDFYVSCSNGCAAGNTHEEAILQGFLELVERDSVALWWYNRVKRPAVDLESFNEPYLGRLREALRKHHRDLWALDLTSDFGIPSIAALSRRTDGGLEQIMFGFGAHLDARVALLRAVTELNQMLSHILEAPPDSPPAQLTDEDTVEWLKTATLANQPYLVPSDEPARTLAGYPREYTEDLKDDILLCQAKVERLGMEMLVLDQTRPEVGLPVVKVIVPGMRHFWPRFAPGRLYDVPVRLGWLPAPVPEEQLNPIPMFL